MNRTEYKSSILALLFLTMFPSWALAGGLSGTWQDAVGIIVNIAENVTAVEKMLRGFLYLAGIVCVVKAVYYFKVYGESRTMMSSQSNLRTPLTWMMVGGVFMFIPSAIDTTMGTIFGSTSILSYSDWEAASSDIMFRQVMEAIFKITQLVGLVAFARGWFIIAQASSGGGGGHASTGKGLIHVVGGILGMNIVSTVNILSNTVGVT